MRYADDCIIFCKSKRSAKRTMEHIIPYIEKKLFLRVNRTKTTVSHVSKIKYLGYGFYRHKGKCRFRVHQKSVQKMRSRLKELTERSKGISNVLFFKLFTASCCTLFTTISKIIPNATSHYSSPIMHIKYCYPKTKHII